MKDYKRIIFGVVLLMAGVVIALNAFGVTDIDVLFPGWWTLFIIIPCGVGIFTDRDKWGNIMGLGVGVVLLLCAQDILEFDIMWKLIVPAIIIMIAVKMIVNGFRSKSRDDIIINVNIDGEIPAGTAIFGGKDMNFDGQKFDGCELTAIFGGVDCDIRNAIIEHDCTIRATSIFGGVDIKMPKNVNVKVNSTNIFGGTSDECGKTPDAPVTVYIESVSIFGGVDLI